MKLTQNGMKPTKYQIHSAPKGRYFCGYGIYLIVVPPKTEHGVAKRKWVYRYTKPTTKRVTETTIGSAYALSYDDAFARATRFRQMVLDKKDPVDVKRQEQAANTLTFGEVAAEWLDRRRSQPDSRNNIKRALTSHAAFLAPKPIAHIDADVIEKAIAPLFDRAPQQARRTLEVWASVFVLAIHKKNYQGENPAAWTDCMEIRFPGRLRDTGKHFPSMPYVEVPEFLRRLRIRQDRSTAAVALEFLILTATRSSETLGAQWGEFDLPNRIWTIPAERMKTEEPHRVPLSNRAIALLERQQEYGNSDQFVFTGYRDARMDDKVMRRILREMEVPLTVHGFRSSFRNWAAKNFPLHRDLAEMSLAHTVKTPVEAVYWTEDALDERRPIMDAWAINLTASPVA